MRAKAHEGLPGVRPTHHFASVAMDTWINLEVVTPEPRAAVEPLASQALAWFGAVERACSRFDPTSELSRLSRQPGQAVPISPLLFETLRFALELAEQTDGAFDPTVGATMEAHGFDRNYRTGERAHSGLAANGATFRDVLLNTSARTVTLRVPLVLDLGAVAKGLALDLAAQALARFQDFSLEAGGDLYVRGHNASNEAWRIGIQHPRLADALAAVAHVSNAAICTSGDYERRARNPAGHHVLDARSGQSPSDLASVSVVAPTAMAADGLSTAAMILGRDEGLALLEEQEVAALLISADGGQQTVSRFGLGVFTAA